MFKGNKTYTLAAVAVGLALAGWLIGSLNIFHLFEAIFAALSIAATRAGIAKVELAGHMIPSKWLDESKLRLPYVKTHISVVLLIVTAWLALLSGNQGVVLTVAITVAAVGVSAVRAAIQQLFKHMVRLY